MGGAESCCSTDRGGGEELQYLRTATAAAGGSSSPRESNEEERWADDDGQCQATPRNFQEEQAVCLAWVLGVESHAKATAVNLRRLHEFIIDCVSVVRASVLMSEASCGIVTAARGRPLEQLSDADSLVRLGQLICRHASSNGLVVTVGIHVGTLECTRVPDLLRYEDGDEYDHQSGKDQKLSFFGSAMSTAYYLASTAEDHHVHLSEEVRRKLDMFRMVRLLLSPTKRTYFLSPTTLFQPYYDTVGSTEGEDAEIVTDSLNSSE